MERGVRRRRRARTAGEVGRPLTCTPRERAVRPRTANQERYLDAIRTTTWCSAIGPAGTGKTYLAVAAAVHMLKHGQAKKVILARPAVEAGEKLGFLPGDLQAKVNPYLRPLFDALNDMMDFETIQRFMDERRGRGRPAGVHARPDAEQSVIILDEAQNTTKRPDADVPDPHGPRVAR